MNVEFVNAEVLRVGPDETLIIRIPERWEDIDGLAEALKLCGLGDRVLVIRADGVEFAVAK